MCVGEKCVSGKKKCHPSIDIILLSFRCSSQINFPATAAVANAEKAANVLLLFSGVNVAAQSGTRGEDYFSLPFFAVES